MKITGYERVTFAFPSNWDQKTPFTANRSFVIGVPYQPWISGNSITFILEHNDQINDPKVPSVQESCKFTVVPQLTTCNVDNPGAYLGMVLFQGVKPCMVYGSCFAKV